MGWYGYWYIHHIMGRATRTEQGNTTWRVCFHPKEAGLLNWERLAYLQPLLYIQMRRFRWQRRVVQGCIASSQQRQSSQLPCAPPPPMPDHGLVQGGSGPAPGEGKHWVRIERWMAQCDPRPASSSKTRFPQMQNGEDNIFCHMGCWRIKKEKALYKWQHCN